MFEQLRIKEHMEVADFGGRRIGTVVGLVDDRIKLSRSDSDGSGHHFIGLGQVDRIEGDRIYLKQGTPIPIDLSAA